MKRSVLSQEKREIGQRLRTLRQAMSDNSQQWFAEEFLGVTLARWNNYELGKRIPDLEMKRILLRKIYGLTIDWIETGNTSGLSGLAAQIISKTHPPRRRRLFPQEEE